MKRRGFTLVELAIVIAILGILAMYAIPKYQGMIDEARSGEARAQLGTFRSALAIYYAKHHGVFPDYNTVNSGAIFAEGTVPYVEVTVNGSPNRSNTVTLAGTQDGTITSTEVANSNIGGWMYDVSSTSDKADVRINSTDTDPAASTTTYWYQY